MKVVLHNGFGGGFHPVDFERGLMNKGWKYEDLWPKNSENFKTFQNRWRSEPDVIELAERNPDYKVIDIPDGSDFKVFEYDGAETLCFYANGRLYTDMEWEEEKSKNGFVDLNSDKKLIFTALEGLFKGETISSLGSITSQEVIGLYLKLKHEDFCMKHNIDYSEMTPDDYETEFYEDFNDNDKEIEYD